MARIESVVKGDIIVERVNGKNRMIPVRRVDINRCSKPSVHINDSACYDWGTDVRLADGEGTLADLEEVVGEVEDEVVEEKGRKHWEPVQGPNPHLLHVHIPNELNHDELAELLVKH